MKIRRFTDYSYLGLFVPWTIRTMGGLFVPWTIHTMDYSYVGLFVRWTFRTTDYSYYGLFVPSVKYSYNNILKAGRWAGLYMLLTKSFDEISNTS